MGLETAMDPDPERQKVTVWVEIALKLLPEPEVFMHGNMMIMDLIEALRGAIHGSAQNC